MKRLAAVPPLLALTGTPPAADVRKALIEIAPELGPQRILDFFV